MNIFMDTGQNLYSHALYQRDYFWNKYRDFIQWDIPILILTIFVRRNVSYSSKEGLLKVFPPLLTDLIWLSTRDVSGERIWKLSLLLSPTGLLLLPYA